MFDEYNLVSSVHETVGTWTTEPESVAAFDALIESLEGFRIHAEVGGYYLQPRLGQHLRTPRIDRILVPNVELLSKGWPYGSIGVECKKSGMNIGPPLSQMLDYSRAAWDMGKGTWIVLQWIFLWPAKQFGGSLLSVLAQNRIGLATPASHPRSPCLALSSGQSLARFYGGGQVEIGAGRNGAGLNGRKVGSR